VTIFAARDGEGTGGIDGQRTLANHWLH